MTRFRGTLVYDGTAYQGFQRQAAGIPTIVGTLEQAIFRAAGQQVEVVGAGRTDAGVHASGQVIAFDAEWRHPEDALLRAINISLPEDIVLKRLCIHEGFHPRFHALSRGYRYTVIQSSNRQPLLRHYAWVVFSPLRLEAMQQAAALLVGTHNFAAFGNPPRGTNTVREVKVSRWSSSALDDGQQYVYEIEATAFLFNMVRRLVGVMVDVGRGAVSIEKFRHIFESADLAQAKRLAPPQGLVLEKVRYPFDT